MSAEEAPASPVFVRSASASSARSAAQPASRRRPLLMGSEQLATRSERSRLDGAEFASATKGEAPVWSEVAAGALEGRRWVRSGSCESLLGCVRSVRRVRSDVVWRWSGGGWGGGSWRSGGAFALGVRGRFGCHTFALKCPPRSQGVRFRHYGGLVPGPWRGERKRTRPVGGRRRCGWGLDSERVCRHGSSSCPNGESQQQIAVVCRWLRICSTRPTSAPTAEPESHPQAAARALTPARCATIRGHRRGRSRSWPPKPAHTGAAGTTGRCRATHRAPRDHGAPQPGGTAHRVRGATRLRAARTSSEASQRSEQAVHDPVHEDSESARIASGQRPPPILARG